MTYKSDKWLWLDADGNVTDQQPSSGSLLVAAGGEISDKLAARHGLTSDGAQSADTTQTKAKAAPPENKAAETSETK